MDTAMRHGKWFIILALAVLTILLGGVAAHSSGTGSFSVGAFWQPPINYPVGTDYNTNANWLNIKNANIDTVVGMGLADGSVNFTVNKASNANGITYSAANNVKLMVTDTSIGNKPSYTANDYAALDTAVTPYKNDVNVKGLYIKDEPYAWDLEGYANTYKHIKAFAPNLDLYVNILGSGIPQTFLITPPPGKLFLSNSGAKSNGSYLSSTNSLGQTITIPAGISYLDGVQFFMDQSQWGTNETVTLKLWNNSAKTQLISQQSLSGLTPTSIGGTSSAPGESYRYFSLNANVTPGNVYFLELVHNGGGDNSIGWVVRSDTDVYPGGAAYQNGVAQTYDFWFRLYTTRTHYGTSYENLLDDWIDMSGADHILFDNYPFLSNSDDPSYFQNAAYVRNRGLANNVRYGAFLQNTGFNGARTPNADEMRWNVYTYLAYGMKMMDWFLYWSPNYNTPSCNDASSAFTSPAVSCTGTINPVYSTVQTLSGEMKKLGTTLKDLTSTNVFMTGNLWSGTTMVPSNFWVKPTDTTQPTVIGTFTNSSGRKYVMLTLNDYKNAASRDITFNFSPHPASITEISKTTGLEVAVPGYNPTTGNVTVTFARGEGHLFALPVGYKNNTYKIIARNSGKALDVAGFSTSDSANVQQWTYNGTTNQQWIVTDLGTGYNKIINLNSGKALDVAGFSTLDSANIQQYTYNGTTNQQWQIIPTDSGFSKVIASNSGKALDVTGLSTLDGANVQQYTYNGTSNQQWFLEEL